MNGVHFEDDKGNLKFIRSLNATALKQAWQQRHEDMNGRRIFSKEFAKLKL